VSVVAGDPAPDGASKPAGVPMRSQVHPSGAKHDIYETAN
jgi:hypothetical protein